MNPTRYNALYQAATEAVRTGVGAYQAGIILECLGEIEPHEPHEACSGSCACASRDACTDAWREFARGYVAKDPVVMNLAQKELQRIGEWPGDGGKE